MNPIAKRKLTTQHGSLVITIPKTWAKLRGWKAGHVIDILADDKRLILQGGEGGEGG